MIKMSIKGLFQILIILSSLILFIISEKQFLSKFLNKIYSNPSSVPLFSNAGSTNYALVNKKPLFSLQIKPEHQLHQEQQLFYNLNNPFNSFYLIDQLPQNNFNNFLNNLKSNQPIKQYDQNLNRKLFYNGINLVNENRLQNEFVDQPHLEEYNHQLIAANWCTNQMLEILQPYCFCGGKNKITKNTIICTNLPNEQSLRRTLNAASILLNIESIYKINKLRIFNSTLDNLNLQSFPKSLSFVLIQMNKCELKDFNQLNILQNSIKYLKKLDLSSNELEEFPFNQLYQLNNLLILKLNYNHLTTIPDNALKGCLKLKMLDLSFNQINYLGNFAFEGAQNLKYLDLRFNKLIVINNYAFAFQPSSIIYFINLSNNQMKYIADNAFDCIVHKLYLNNNKLKKFNQQLFEPILINMAKINIERKIFYGENNDYEINYRNNLNISKINNLIIDSNSTIESNNFLKLNNNQTKYYLDIYETNLKSTQLLNNFKLNLNYLIKLNLTDDYFDEFVYDLILDDLNLIDLINLNRTKRESIMTFYDLKSSNSIENKSNKLLDVSNSFREEIKTTNNSLVFFDDEPDQKNELIIKPTPLDYENNEIDDNSAFILVSDNNFECNCLEFEWLFKLKKSQLKSLKGFQCSNLIGQKKFLYLNQLTLQDINCWNFY